MSLSAAQRLADVTGILLPTRIEIRDRYWYAPAGARAGWLAVKKKYGRVPVDEHRRKRRWREWWEREGRFKPHPIISVSKNIKRPRYSLRLAEFVGIMIGDGGITPFQVTVSLNSVDDKKYAIYVRALLKELFNVPVAKSIRSSQRSLSLTVSRVELVRFCRDRLGLKVGNKLKQGLDIPAWIHKKESYERACLRGLMDTDGCIFNECHLIKGKRYCYPRTCFVSASPVLCRSVYLILKKLGFAPRIRTGRKVQLEQRRDIIDYFALVGTNNPKHRARFDAFTRRS